MSDYSEWLMSTVVRSLRFASIDSFILVKPSTYMLGSFPGYATPQLFSVIEPTMANDLVNASLAPVLSPIFRSATPREFRSHGLSGAIFSPDSAISRASLYFPSWKYIHARSLCPAQLSGFHSRNVLKSFSDSAYRLLYP